VFCNESGYWVTFVSDEYGYNNPSGVWRDQSKFENVFVGDSFTLGHCVKQGESFVDRIREQVPRTLNLGMDATGPLVMLARIKEYLTGRRMGHVFWVYYEGNDLRELVKRELPEPILNKYLNDDFAQDIKSNRKAINSALISLIENTMEEIKREEQEEPGKVHWALSHIFLRNVRLLLFQFKKNYFQPDVRYDLNIFRQVMSKAKTEVEKHRGRLVFVYLPDYYRYENTRRLYPAARMKDDVIKLVNALDIDVIDIDSAFRQLDDPSVLFPFGQWGHYNSRGHKIVADEILNYLKEHKSNGDR